LFTVDSGDTIQGAPPLEVRVFDTSAHGVGIRHSAPLPDRLVVLAFETEADGPVRLLVRLKWCRFKHADVYESGGLILRVLNCREQALQANNSPSGSPHGTST